MKKLCLLVLFGHILVCSKSQGKCNLLNSIGKFIKLGPSILRPSWFWSACAKADRLQHFKGRELAKLISLPVSGPYICSLHRQIGPPRQEACYATDGEKIEPSKRQYVHDDERPHPKATPTSRQIEILHPHSKISLATALLTNSEEHREVFPEPPLIAFRRCKNLKDIFVRVWLSSEGNGRTDKKGCSRCGKSRCQVCNVMSNTEHFYSNVDSREYRIHYSFNCDSSNVVYLLECTACGVQYVGSTCTPFRLRFNNYKACSRKFDSGASVPHVEFFRHFTGEGHHGFLQDISVKTIDRLTGGNRMRESFWQYRLDCFSPKGLNTRQVDT